MVGVSIYLLGENYSSGNNEDMEGVEKRIVY